MTKQLTHSLSEYMYYKIFKRATSTYTTVFQEVDYR